MSMPPPSDRTRMSLLAALGGDVTTPGTGAHAAKAAEAPLPEAPERIGGVRLVRLLGRGGMGEVYLGRHETLDIDVAVKLVIARVDADALIAEARAAARIQHEHVVRLLHAGTENGQPFLVMELVGGGDVDQLLRRRGYLPWREAARLAAQAADGLGAAHAAGFIHRDVKPANLMLSIEGSVKIADLGLARRLSSASADAGGGTPAYMAPELWKEPARATPAADVYALGATLFQMLTGEQPFIGDAATLLEDHRSTEVPDPRRIVPDVPRALAELVQRMMSKDPSLRPADGAVAAREIRTAASTSSENVAAVPPRQRRSGRAGWRLPAAVALVLVAASGGLAMAANRPTTPWATPPRATFLIGDKLPPATAAAVTEGLRGTGLQVIEREAIDHLVREQDLGAQSRVDTATAISNGRLIGGHVAVFAQAEGEQVALSAVLVETGERTGMTVVPAEHARDAAQQLASDAAERLPARGVISTDGSGGFAIDLGSRHGVRVGDRFRVYTSPAASGAQPTAVATVVAVQPDRAKATIEGPAPDRSAQVERIER